MNDIRVKPRPCTSIRIAFDARRWPCLLTFGSRPALSERERCARRRQGSPRCGDPTGSGLDPGSAQASQATTAGRGMAGSLEVPMIVDTEASMHFLRTAYEPDDWIALFLKSYETGQTLQRVGPLSLFLRTAACTPGCGR